MKVEAVITLFAFVTLPFLKACHGVKMHNGLRRKTRSSYSNKSGKGGKGRVLRDEDIRSRTVEYCAGGKAGKAGKAGTANGKAGSGKSGGRRLTSSNCSCGKGGGPCWVYGDPYDDPVDPIDGRVTDAPIDNDTPAPAPAVVPSPVAVPTPAVPTPAAPSPAVPPVPTQGKIPAPDTAPPAALPEAEDDFESRTNESLDREFEYDPYVPSGSNDINADNDSRTGEISNGPGIDIVVTPPMNSENDNENDEADVPSNDGNANT
jgi:hypothetical protein